MKKRRCRVGGGGIIAVGLGCYDVLVVVSLGIPITVPFVVPLLLVNAVSLVNARNRGWARADDDGLMATANGITAARWEQGRGRAGPTRECGRGTQKKGFSSDLDG